MRCANEGCIYHAKSQNNYCVEYRDMMEELCDEFIKYKNPAEYSGLIVNKIQSGDIDND